MIHVSHHVVSARPLGVAPFWLLVGTVVVCLDRLFRLGELVRASFALWLAGEEKTVRRRTATPTALGPLPAVRIATLVTEILHLETQLGVIWFLGRRAAASTGE